MTTYDDALTAIQQLEAERAELRSELDEALTSEQALQYELDAALARIAELEAGRPDPEPEPTSGILVGMSAPERDWPTRLREVGPDGITARRIFADLADGPRDKKTTIDEAVAANMMPVISYKIGGDINGALAGRFDQAADEAAAFLATYNVEMAVTFWHEPNGDLTGPQLVALHDRLLRKFKRGKIKVGPILNGWQLTAPRQLDTFKTYVSRDLLDGLYDYFGIDTYQNPDKLDTNPGDRIDPLVKVLTDYGHGDMPLLIGEYNCHTAADVTAAGEKFLSTPTMWCFLMWNANGTGTAQARVLSSERLEAFRATKADPRAAR